MPQSLTELAMEYVIGSPDVLERMQKVPVKEAFDEGVIDFLNQVSKKLLANPEAKAFPDVVTFGFWIRKSSLVSMKERYANRREEGFFLGRGLAFHIAPSNVPVNYAYSLVSSLLCGNKNIVRIPSKDFEQVRIINDAFLTVLAEQEDMSHYIILVRYGHDEAVNKVLSSLCDVRIIWGGDETIESVRKAELKPRATEVTFADRYSLAVIDAEAYLRRDDKRRIAADFYNDTFLTDQNACTSPRAVVWVGEHKQEAKDAFWSYLHELVESKYQMSGVQAINKLTSGYLLAASGVGAKKVKTDDNMISRVSVARLLPDLMKYKENSGFFLEYECDDILELAEFCNDTKCQTLSYMGEKEMFIPLIKSGLMGLDRIVPIGHTMDYDLDWDGYDLYERLTRKIKVG